LGVLGHATIAAWAVIVAALGWIFTLIALVTLERRQRSIVADALGAAEAVIDELRVRLALAEALFALASEIKGVEEEFTGCHVCSAALAGQRGRAAVWVRSG